MTQPIWYDSTEAGAPTLNNVAGSLLEVLRACLINGFNAKTVTSIAVASGVATATCAAHGYSDAYGKLVQISGATEPLLNGNKQISNPLTNSFTFPAPGVADGTYTGTLSAKRAPLGWTEPHTGTNVAIFARSAPEASAQMLRVLDDAAAPTEARAQCVESATDANTVMGAAPTLAGGYFWFKGANTATAKRWVLVGDDRCFHLFTDLSGLGHYRSALFGDVVSFKAADGYPCMVAGERSSGAGAGVTSWPGMCVTNPGSAAPTEYLTLARGHAQTGSSVSASVHHVGLGQMGTFGPAQPGLIFNGCVVSQPVFVSEVSGPGQQDMRGIMPGIAQPLAVRPFTALQVVGGLAGSGKSFLAVPLIASNSGQMLVDLTGPWY